MKKLCTYLTLFVLGLLALAQPAAAKDYTFYFRLPSSGWTTPPGFHWWGCGTSANVDGSTSSPVSMKPVTGESNLYSVTLKDADETGGNIMFKTGDSWNPQTTAITELKDGYIYEITGGSGQNCIAEPKEEYSQGGSVTKMYIRGVFTGSNSTWGSNPDVEMPYNEDLGLYYYEPSSTGDFMISTTTGTSFWNGRHQNMAGSGKLTLPDSKPASQNIQTGGGDGRDLTLPALGTIYFDKNEMKIWYEVSAQDPVDYTFYLNPGNVSWSDVYVMLFESSDSNWDGFKHYTTKLSNGYYKFEVKGVTNAGKMLFKSDNDGSNWPNKEVQSRDIESADVKNGALYTLGEMVNDKGYDYTTTEAFDEATAAFYVYGPAFDNGGWSYDGAKRLESSDNGKTYTVAIPAAGIFALTTYLGPDNSLTIADAHKLITTDLNISETAQALKAGAGNLTLPNEAIGGTLILDAEAKTLRYEPSAEFAPGASKVWMSVGNGAPVQLQNHPKDNKVYYSAFSGANNDITLWWGNESDKTEADHRLGWENGGILASDNPSNVTFGNSDVANISTGDLTSGLIFFDSEFVYQEDGQDKTIMKVFAQPENMMYIQGPAITGGWLDVKSMTNAGDGIYTYVLAQEGNMAIAGYCHNDYYYLGRIFGPASLSETEGVAQDISTNGEGFSQDISVPAAAVGKTLTVDTTNNKMWWGKRTYSGSLYAKGPGFDGNTEWGSFTLLSGSNGVFSFDVKLAAEFCISESTEDAGIYMPVGIDNADFPFTVPTGEANAKAISKRYVFGKNFKAPAANGKIFIDMNDLKIWYEPKQETLPTELWAKGPGASGDWSATIKLESDGDGLFHFTAPSAGPFAISDTDNLDVFDNTAWGPVEGGTNIQVDVPTSMPELANVEHKAEWGNDFRATGAGVIWFDAKNLKLWSGERILPTLYTFYVKIDDSYASQWGDDTCYLYTFNEGDDKWTSINGQCVRYDRRLADGVYKFIVRGQTSKGRMLFKNTAGASDMQEYYATILPADIRPRALYTISAKGDVTVAPEDYVENNVFEAGKAYYVDASGCSWFENDNCTLGVKYDGDVHYGGTIVKVSSSPLVYRFTVNDDQTEIEVGRRNNQVLHNAVTVQAPTDGSNCIYVKEDNGVLVFDSWGTYSPAGGLYILGSSNTIAGDWKDATPIAMNYDETEDVFYYMVQGTNASPDYPIEFLISRGASNADFFKAENAFMPVREGYIHMAESDYKKGKPGYEDNKYFKLISRGRVMVRYIKDKDGIPTGVKIWYEPVVWPDLYILGSIIADPNDTQSVKSTHEQWETFGKLKMDEKQPGLYYYDLGLGDNKDLFNLQPYPVTGGAFGDIDEHGHFNFSFRGTGTDTGRFWDDAFVPATSTSMGTLNRDGVPVPFCYRDSKPDPNTKWVSTNFVFGERSRIWVDVVRQLVWVETFTDLSGNQVVFDFWDKGGTAYSKEDGYQWWSANDATTHNIQSYLVDDAGNLITNDDSPYTLKPADLSWQALEVIDNVGSGVRYHFVAELPASYYEKDGEGNVTDKVANGYHVWIRIKDNANSAHEILRPYAYQATYTQGPKGSDESINYNYYGNIKAAGAPIVTIEPSVNMIYADVEAPEHLGHFREFHVMHYPYVNQYSTAVTVNPDDVYPFYVVGVTKPATMQQEDGSVVEIEGEYVPADDARFTFAKSNQVTVSYGSIRETKYGTTGKAVIKGIDHANAAAADKMDVRVTYTSEGLIFARTKTVPLKIDANELPTMQTSADNNLDVAAFFSGTACSEGLTVDLILHQKFAFRPIMTEGGEADGKTYTPRAAYVGYEVNIDADKVNDHSHVAEGHEHMAKNGVPLMWDFTDDHNRDIKGYTDLDKWHYEAFTGKSMAIQLHHAACGKTKAELEGKSVTGSVTFHLYVPVATEFAFETGTTSLVRGMHKAGEQVNSKVLGDPNHPYTGSVSAKSYDSFTQPIDFSFAGNITTGVEGVGVEDAPVEFYNLQGVRMTSETLAPGIYIRRQGNETSKVYIR